MIKLYNFPDAPTHYWIFWQDKPGNYVLHQGPLGEEGEVEDIGRKLLKSADTRIAELEAAKRAEGYVEIPIERLHVLMIEYPVDGFGTQAELDKRNRLQARMDETLGWTGLGHCDGGSSGSGTMEVFCFVVAPQMALDVVRRDLEGTEFDDYSQIVVTPPH